MRISIIVKGAPLTSFLRRFPVFLREYSLLRKQADMAHTFPFEKLYPCLLDRNEESGTAYGHYFHQDLLIANKVFNNRPQRHVDIGSRMDGFVAHVASFREIEVFDIRRLKNPIKNVIFKKVDLMGSNFELINYCDSVSCLHALEHFGLGRYGDKLDYNGHLRGWENITMMLKPGGKFYFAVPIGQQRIEFNAHRVFSLNYLLALISKDYVIDSFSYVNDQGSLFENVALTPESIKTNLNCSYGCGIFELSKSSDSSSHPCPSFKTKPVENESDRPLNSFDNTSLPKLKSSKRFLEPLARRVRFALREHFRRSYNLLNNSDNDNPNRNGEYYHLERILRNAPQGSVLIDLGGQFGAWSERAIRIRPDCRIFIFEPIPDLQEEIHSRFKGMNQVVLVEGAADREDGEIEIFLDTQSTYKRDSVGRSGGQKVKCASIALSRFFETQKISSVYFMKMDIEGHELNVLSGLSKLLSEGFFNHVQFEYGGCNIDSRTLLIDFFRCFEKGPYRLAKIHSRYLEYISKYDQKYEDFQNSNWLAEKI